MDQKTITISIVFFAVLVAGMFGYTYLKKAELVEQSSESELEAAESVPYPNITRIDAKHFFINDVHTLAGELVMPTPCDLLEVEARELDEAQTEIHLYFNVINNAEFCAQAQTPQRFMISVPARQDTTFKAFFMGREVELNLVPPQAGETPEDFEVFIKG